MARSGSLSGKLARERLFIDRNAMIANHPEREQIRLENVLTALGNPLRLAVVRRLAAGGEHACGTLVHGLSKSTLTHHWRVLRESGVIWQRPCGRESLLSLRREDIDARFPGLLDVLLSAVENDATTDESTARHLPEDKEDKEIA
ncbi:ArsR family transcriptional regulator [Yersinia massiliensis]|nr:ArsR family transcriptional regulator [Yersinia massiliensis]